MARHIIPDTIERAEPRRERVSAPARPVALSLVLSLRPSQWTKNLIIFAGLMFGQRLQDVHAVLYAVGAFAVFCVLSGVVYLLNDVADRESDRSHPVKRYRPVASGDLPVPVALMAAAVLGTLALAGGFWLRPAFGVIGTIYVALLACYSGPLKHIVIIDVLTIAIGFVLRAAAGAVVIEVPISHWLLFLTILLALFLALSKRRHELVLLADGATSHRRILGEYTPYLLDQMIAVVTASTLVAYAIYTVSPETVEKFHTQMLGLTLPFPLYGIFRYLYLVHQREGGGSPAEMLLNDRPLLMCVALWAAAVGFIIYGPDVAFLDRLIS
jgi:4-hydroxybenzoate polyprenyltransferase